MVLQLVVFSLFHFINFNIHSRNIRKGNDRNSSNENNATPVNHRIKNKVLIILWLVLRLSKQNIGSEAGERILIM